MTQLDLEDTNFLEDLSEELRRHDGVYEAEAVELDNIIFRSKEETSFQKVNFTCSVCGKDSWMEVNLSTYVVSITDLVCDDCNPVEEDE